MDRLEQILSQAGLASSPSAEAEPQLRAVEQRIGRPLPAHFRHFTALKGAGQFLHRFSNQDRPIDVSDLGKALERWYRYDPLGEAILPFMWENQGVCVWGIRLDAGDDPPIVVDVDSGSPPRWDLCADSFTNWLACQLWDWGGPEWRFAANGPPLEKEVVSRLRQRFSEGPPTWAWPGKANYRFSNERSRLLIWSGDDQCDWWIAPLMPELELDALDEIDRLAGIGGILYDIQ